MAKYYVGISVAPSRAKVVFTAASTPTDESHGHLYRLATGPFRTRRAAELCASGEHAPYIVSVSQFEAEAKRRSVSRETVSA